MRFKEFSTVVRTMPVLVGILIISILGIAGIMVLVTQVIISPVRLSHPIGSTITTYSPPTGASTDALTWSPDDTLIASSESGAVHIWNATTGRVVFTCCRNPSTDDAMQAIAWSPDGKRIATGDVEGKVKIWNVKTGELISSYTGSACSELPLNCSVSVVVWSPDGRYIASGSCGVIDPLTPDNVAVQIRNAITGDLVLTYHGHSSCVQNITWPSNSRNIISSSSDNTMRIWDTGTGNTLFLYRDNRKRAITAVAAPNGKYIAVTSVDQIVNILDAKTKQSVSSYTIPVPPNSERNPPEMVWSPDSTRITSNYNGILHVWNAMTGDDIATYDDSCCEREKQIAWSPDGTRIAFINGYGQIKVWQASQDPLVLSRQWRFLNPINLLSLCGIVLIMAVAIFFIVRFTRVKSIDTSKCIAIVSIAFIGIAGCACLAVFMHASTIPTAPSFPIGTTFYNFGGNTVAWSPDGSRITTGLADGTIYVWDATTGERIVTNRTRSSVVTAISWSPDGTHIAAGYNDGVVQILDAATGQRTYTYTRHVNSIVAVAWSPDSTHIASVSAPDNMIYVWQASDTPGKTITEHKGTAVTWSPDSSLIASPDGANNVHIWQASSGRDVLTYHSQTLIVTSVAWSPNGKYIASGNHDGIVEVWEANTGKLRFSYDGHTQPVHALAWSPDSARIASGTDEIHIWDALTGRHVFPYVDQTLQQAEAFSVLTLAWSPDGTRIVSASTQGIVRIWQAAQESNTVGGFPQVFTNALFLSVLFILSCLTLFILLFTLQRVSRRKRLVQFIYTALLVFVCFVSVFSISDLAAQTPRIMRTAVLNNAALPQAVLLHRYRGYRAALSPDGRYLATSWFDKIVQIWDLSSGDRAFAYRSRPGAVYEIAWSPDGTRIASGYKDGTVRIWDAHTGRDLLTYSGHTAAIDALAWSPDSTRLLSMNYEDATQDNTIHVWNSSTGQTLLTMHISVNDVAWSPDGTRIALIGVANTNFGTEIRDATTGQELLAYPTKQVSALAWSPDGKTVALGSGYGTADGIIQEWDATAPHLLFTFPKGFETDFNALSWSPDGKYIVSGGEHGIIDIWNAATGQHLLEALASFNIVFGVAWSPNNHYVLSWGGQAVDIWQTPMNVSG